MGTASGPTNGRPMKGFLPAWINPSAIIDTSTAHPDAEQRRYPMESLPFACQSGMNKI